MKTEIDTLVLRDALRMVKEAITRRTVMPILSGVLFSADNLEATNLTVRITVKLPVTFEQPFLVDALKLLGVVESFSTGTTTLRLTEKRLVVSCGAAQAQFPLMAAEDFPKPAKHNNLVGEFSPDVLHAIMTKVVPFALDGQSEPVLSGVFLTPLGDETVCYSADRYRVSRLVVPAQLRIKEGLIVPAQSIALAQKVLVGDTVRLTATAEQLSLFSDKAFFSTQLIAGQYPNLEAAFPREFSNVISVGAGVLSSALRLVEPFCENTTRVSLDAGEGSLNVGVATSQTGDANSDVPASVTGGEKEFGIGFGFLSSALKAFGAAPLDLSLTPQGNLVQLSSPNYPNYKLFLGTMTSANVQ